MHDQRGTRKLKAKMFVATLIVVLLNIIKAVTTTKSATIKVTVVFNVTKLQL